MEKLKLIAYSRKHHVTRNVTKIDFATRTVTYDRPIGDCIGEAIFNVMLQRYTGRKDKYGEDVYEVVNL